MIQDCQLMDTQPNSCNQSQTHSKKSAQKKNLKRQQLHSYWHTYSQYQNATILANTLISYAMVRFSLHAVCVNIQIQVVHKELRLSPSKTSNFDKETGELVTPRSSTMPLPSPSLFYSRKKQHKTVTQHSNHNIIQNSVTVWA